MSKPLVTNAANEDQVKEAKVKVKTNRQTELNDLRSLLALPAARRFIAPYLNICDRISASDSGSWTYFKEGERNIANRMKADVIEADAQAYLLTMKEFKERNL